jgi:phage major head subunit gpT-like protein
MRTLSIMPFLLAFFAAVAAMPTNVYQVCAWGAGTLAVDPWRKGASALRNVTQGIRSWIASLWSPRIAFACAAVLFAIMVAHLGASDGVILATAPVVAVATLQSNRAQLVREAEALRAADGTFASDEARSSFDVKMAQVDALDTQIRQAQAAPAPAPAPTVNVEEVRAAELSRFNGITDAVRLAKLDRSVADDMIKRNLTLDQARAEIFAKLAAQSEQNPTRSHVAVGEGEQEKFLRGATNWLIVKAGMADVIARATKTEVSSFDPGEFRGMTLVELAREALTRSGRQVRGRDKQAIVGDAFTVRDGAITQSTSDFATLLENVMHKMLQAAYAIQPDTWRKFCATSTVSDFRAHNRYRMGTFGSLDSIAENGEFKNKGITDGEKATITAATKGNIVNVSRQMIINDDMNAFSRILSMLGRAAALSVEVDVYALLAQNSGLGPSMPYDATTLFHANHGNIPTGAALSADAIDLDRVAMAQQRDKDSNDYLDLRPAVLLVPVGLGGKARIINQSQYNPDRTANAKASEPNVVVGLFREVVDTPRLSGTRRYLFADPSIAPVLEVAFLEGQDAPVLETQDGWRVDGAETKVRFDYGVAAVDHRGAVTNAGV